MNGLWDTKEARGSGSTEYRPWLDAAMVLADAYTTTAQSNHETLDSIVLLSGPKGFLIWIMCHSDAIASLSWGQGTGLGGDSSVVIVGSHST